MSGTIDAPVELIALIEANARLWAGEAEVFAAYFGSPQRTAATDEAWLVRQCYKELIDGVAGRLAQLTQSIDESRGATQALADDVVKSELEHYAVFAMAHRAAAAMLPVGERPIRVRFVGVDWAENAALQTMRSEHLREYGDIGRRAAAFTEGGYGTLYLAGMRLAGGSALDDAIAQACTRVFDDECEHMLQGIAGLAAQPLSRADWQCLERLTLEQGRLRIRMRNAQFGHPLSSERVRELEAGAAEPLAFDYARAGLRPR